MNCIVWNCRGAGNTSTGRDLVAHTRAHSPSMIFLCETRHNKEKMYRLCNRVGLRGFEGVSSNGRSGGLALFWHESMYVDVQEANERLIDVYLRVSPDKPLWRATFVYGEPRVENRHMMWDKLKGLHAQSALPWVIIGDFNEAIWDFEHQSEPPRPLGQRIIFRDALEACGLTDLGFSGHPFTYDNRRSGRANVQVRLDRAVASNDWRDMFMQASVAHLVSSASDHSPLLLKFSLEQDRRPRSSRRYELMWERSPALEAIITKSWSSKGTKRNLGDVREALATVMADLHTWSKKTFGNVTCELEKSRTRLEELTNMNADRA